MKNSRLFDLDLINNCPQNLDKKKRKNYLYSQIKGRPLGMANEGSIHFIRWVTSPSSDRNRDAKQTPPSSVSQTSEFMQLWWISQLHRIAWIPFKDVRPIKTIKYGVMVLQICAFSWFFNEFKFIFCEVFFCYFRDFNDITN